MKILIIGGTKFLGRHLINAALVNGHEVTIFNRGRHSQENFENVEQIRGDRNTDLEKLAGRKWDAVIDTCGYMPQTVKTSAEFFKDSAETYVFISSISAYKSFAEPDFDETAETVKLSEEQEKEFQKIDPKADITAQTLGEMYGALKVLCEREAEKAMPERVLNVRSGLIVGAFDPTDRFTYWAARVAKGGEMLAPGDPDSFVQIIDARDLSEWIIKMVERKQTGIFNATGKPFELTFGKMLDEIKASAESDAEFVWVSEEFLERENVQPWSEMPLFLPGAEFRGFLSANVDKALQKGLSFRSLRDTIRDTLDWRQTKNEELKAGISSEREKELLQKRREKF
jgi:2'-hydroxyisoflavone reductase